MLDIFLQALVISGGLFWVGLKFYKGKSRRWGGIILTLVFVGLVLAHRELEITRQLAGVLLGSFLILAFGIWDDFKNLSWKVQIIFQIVLVGILVYFGFNIEYFTGLNGQDVRVDKLVLQGISIGSFTFIFLWVVGIINAINWADGADSTMGSIAIIGGLSLLFVSLLPEVNQPAIAIITSIFLGSLAGFLLFNLPPARIEAGTSGSYFVGFILASLAIIAGGKIITIMIVLILPVVDFLWVIFERWQDKKSIFKKDKRHLHYKLRSIGWSDRSIFLSYFIFLGSVLVVYSWIDNRGGRIILLTGEIVLIMVVFIVIKYKIDTTKKRSIII